MKECIFKKFITNRCVLLHIPILFMITTFDMQLYQLLQQMTGILIKAHNIFWGDVSSFSKRNIRIEIKYSNQPLRVLKQTITNKLLDTTTSKAIIYGNVAAKLSTYQEKFDTWIDMNKDIKGDSVLVIGDQETELKFGYTTAFTNTVIPETSNETSSEYHPRFFIWHSWMRRCGY